MEGSGEPVSPFDSYVDLNPQALMVEGPRAAAQSIPAAGGGAGGGASVTSAPARMASLEAMSPHAASPSSTGAAPAALNASLPADTVAWKSFLLLLPKRRPGAPCLRGPAAHAARTPQSYRESQGKVCVWRLIRAGEPSPVWHTGVLGAEETAAEGDEVEEDRETLHRLCPTYAQDINSPLRHVRTRIYFTSESHMHSLINVLRYSHLCKLP